MAPYFCRSGPCPRQGHKNIIRKCAAPAHLGNCSCVALGNRSCIAHHLHPWRRTFRHPWRSLSSRHLHIHVHHANKSFIIFSLAFICVHLRTHAFINQVAGMARSYKNACSATSVSLRQIFCSYQRNYLYSIPSN